MSETTKRCMYHLGLGRAHYLNGDLDGAMKHLHEAEPHCGKFADLHNMLGVIFYQKNLPRKAIERFQKALQINPGYLEAALHLAICYNEAGEYDKAKQAYQQALRWRETDEQGAFLSTFQARVANLHAQLAETYRAGGRLQAAVHQMMMAVETCPSFPDLRLKYSIFLREAGDHERAAIILESLCQERPDYLPAAIQLGLSYWLEGKASKAKLQWNRVLKTDPQNPAARFYLQSLEK